MQNRTFLSTIGAALLVGCIAACSDSTSPSAASSFDTQVANDVAPSAGAEIAANIGLYSGTSNASVPVPTANCVYRPARTIFDCPRFASWLGHSDSVAYVVYQTGTVIDSVHFTVTDTSAVSFMHNDKTFADTGGRHLDATVGITDSIHTWNGTAAGSITSVRMNASDTVVYQLSVNDTTTNLQFSMPRLRHRFPIAGTIVLHYTATRVRTGSDTTQRSASGRIVVTFNGTQTPTMTVNGASTYSLDLVTAAVALRHR